MPEDGDDNISNLDDKVYDKHVERVRGARGTPMRSETRYGFLLDVHDKSWRETYVSSPASAHDVAPEGEDSRG
jgi:hypothetical protein